MIRRIISAQKIILSFICLPLVAFGQFHQGTTANGDGATAYSAGRDINVGVEITGAKIAVTEAYMIPSFFLFPKQWNSDGSEVKTGFYDSAFLCVEVANISSEPFLVTAMRLDILNARNVKFGPQSQDACSSNRVSLVSRECYLQPGEKKKWVVGDGFVIDGLVDYLGTEKDEYIDNFSIPKRTNNGHVIQRFNRFLQKRIGRNAELKLTIFERDYQPALIGKFQLAHGEDMFKDEPIKANRRLHRYIYPLKHDLFLGEAISHLVADDYGRMGFGSLCQEKGSLPLVIGD